MSALIFDPRDPGVLDDPYPAYAELRAHPNWARTPDGAWVISSYRDVREALLAPRCFSCADTNGLTPRQLPVLVGTDPPDHTRLRRLTSTFFTGSARETWRRPIESCVRDVITSAVARGHLEAVEQLCSAIPVAVLADVMNIERRRLKTLLADSTGELRRNRRQVLADFFRAELAQRRSHPGTDLISQLCQRSADGDELTEDEIIAHCVLLLAAGIDAPRDLLANLLDYLAQPGRPWPLTSGSDPAATVEEALRFFSPVQGVFRTARVPIIAAHQEIQPGERVLILIGSANRDETVWECPDQLRPHRYAAGARPHAAAHLGLGAGVHACLGAVLARVITGTALATLTDLGLRIRPAAPIVRGRNACFRRVLRLEVVVEPCDRDAASA